MRVWFRTVVIVMAGMIVPQMAAAETLADALIAAYRNSNLLEQNRAVLRAADEDAAVAIAALRPVIAFSAGSSWQRAIVDSGAGDVLSEELSSSIGLSADLTLFDFGRNRLGVEIARESVHATRQALIQVEQEVLLAAVEAYVDVRLAQDVVALRQSNFRLITQELRAAEDRFEVGETTRTDVAIAEARLAGSRSALAAAEGNLMIAREAYKAATGDYPGQLAALPRLPDLPGTLEDAQAVALATHPLIGQSQYQVTVADLQVALAEAGTRPSISAGLDLGLDEDGRDSESLSLSLSQTIYAGGRLSALQRRAIAVKDQAQAALHQTAVSIVQNLGVSWASLAVSAASIAASQEQIRAAQTAFDGIRQEADLGARTTLDVLDAEQELLDARNARLEAEADGYVGVYRVLSAMGLLTVDHLQLGIPTYDAEAYYDTVKTAPSHSVQGKKLDRILDAIGD